MTSEGPVAIFWDFGQLFSVLTTDKRLTVVESCYPAPTSSGYAVLNNIRRIGHQFGTITLLKAYLKLSEQMSSRSSSLRSELQSSGVSLIDCPGGSLADKMMLGLCQA